MPFFDYFRLVSSYYQLKYNTTSDKVFEKHILPLAFNRSINDSLENFLDLYDLNLQTAKYVAVLYWIILKNRAVYNGYVSKQDSKKFSQIVLNIYKTINDEQFEQ